MTDDTKLREFEIDASSTSTFKAHNGAGGIPGPVTAYPQFPDLAPVYREAGLTLVRSHEWISRLDTRNNPRSLFPDWDADPTDPRSYNFAATDEWVETVHGVGADVLFVIASAIPQNKLPALDVDKYGVVVEHVVRHFAQGWANGPEKPVRQFEFGDQPDLGPLHFDGPAEAFYDMYEAFVQAVLRVDETLTLGGPSLAFPLNADAPMREGFLEFVRERGLRLDFFSFLWFVDKSRDPLEFRYVAEDLRTLLDRYGFERTRLMLSYWNYIAIPDTTAPPEEKGAFQAATAIYLQDTAIDDALFFRADSGLDPHYGFNDPGGITTDGEPDARAVALTLIGRTLRGQRLAVAGGDESGLTAAAGLDGDVVRVLVANFEAPAAALERRESDEFVFKIPIGPSRIDLAMRLAPQRADLESAHVEAARVRLTNLPWQGRTVSITAQTLREDRHLIREDTVSASGELAIDIPVGPQTVTLLEIAAS